MKPQVCAQQGIGQLLEQVAQQSHELWERPDDLCGQVLWGANNIFWVLCQDGNERQCRLRGKTLNHQGVEQEHNPLICGDFVLLEGRSLSGSEGQIYRRIQRRNSLLRRNLKRGEPQAFAANIDTVILMVSWAAPPLRPAFLDRLLIAAQRSGSPIILIINKIDCIQRLSELPRLCRFLRQYRKLGLKVWPLSLKMLQTAPEPQQDPQDQAATTHSAATGIAKLAQWLECQLTHAWLRSVYLNRSQACLQNLYRLLAGQLYVLLGASGVGKSSLCNYLFPQQSQEIRAISQKWQRGVHTTTLARTLSLQDGPDCYRLIDTPGMRNFLPEISQDELPTLQDYYPEFSSLRKICGYSSCQHRREPDCAVRDAAEYGLIANQRYLSYINLYSDLESSFIDKPDYQTQGKSSGRNSSQLPPKGLDKSASIGLNENQKNNSKGKGRRGDPSQSCQKERKQKRSKLQLHSDEQGNFDCEDF